MYIVMNGMYGSEGKSYYMDVGVGCFSFTPDKEYATDMPEHKCMEIMEHEEWYCDLYKAKNLEMEG